MKNEKFFASVVSVSNRGDFATVYSPRVAAAFRLSSPYVIVNLHHSFVGPFLWFRFFKSRRCFRQVSSPR